MPADNNLDLERCVTAFTEPFSSSKAGRNCSVAVQRLDGRTFLMDAAIEGVGSDLVFNSAKKQISQVLTKSWYQRLVGKLLVGLVVGTARVKQVIHCGPQPRVYLQDFTLDPLLTEALDNPHLHIRSTTYPLNPNDLGSSPTDNDKALGHQDVDVKSTSTCTEHDDQEIIVVRRVIDRAKVAWLLILLLFASPALGIGVGFCSHDADVGIAVSVGIFAMASFVQGLVAWIQG